nr:hypothetical protein [Tanacetum cinerariifolium]
MMGEVDIDTLTIKQYLMLTQGNQASGMIKSEFGGMKEKDIEDMIIVEYMEYEEEEMINTTDDDKSFTPKPRPEEEELSSDEDLDDWLKLEMERHMCGQDKEDKEDALVAILQSLVGECKAVYANKGA